MTEFFIANMAPIIFISMVVFLLVGFPVAFALAANGVVFITDSIDESDCDNVRLVPILLLYLQVVDAIAK